MIIHLPIEKSFIMILLLAFFCIPFTFLGCATTGTAGDGIVMITETGDYCRVTPEEIEILSGIDQPYYLQVGDVIHADFRVQSLRQNRVPWDYKIETGDSMEVRFLPSAIEPGEYRLQTGDVIGIYFLDNWQLNVTRTVRPDGMVSAPEIGDINARGLTALQLRDTLRAAYVRTGIIQGEPRITVNVDFVNLDRYSDMSRDVVVRPDGAISLPGLDNDVRIAGLTVTDAAEKIKLSSLQYLNNTPQVALVVFPAVDTNILSDMSGSMQIRPDGRITIPRLGEFQAAGYSLDELRETLLFMCGELLHNPVELTVDLLRATGGRIYVGGEVNMPGVYPLEGSPTALQAVISANGFMDTSRLNNVIVMRRNPNGSPYIFNTNLRVVLSHGQTENDIHLRPFDVVYVPKKTISKMNLFVDQYINNLVPFDNTLGVSAQYYINEQRVRTRGTSVNFNTGITGMADVLNP